jgi:predicted amidohydrolase
MPRNLRVAAIQVGRIDRGESRRVVLARLESLLEDAASKGVRLAVFPETTLCAQTNASKRARLSRF